MNLDKKTVRIAASITLTYRLVFATIIFYAAKESDTAFLQGILLAIMSIMVTVGSYRFVKLMNLSARLGQLDKKLDSVN